LYNLNKRDTMNTKNLIIVLLLFFTCIGTNAQEDIKLKDYQPVSIYNIPVSDIKKARYPVIDMHSHVYAVSEEEIDKWVKNMDAAGIEKTVLLSGYTGYSFDSLVTVYSKYPSRFEFWCGLDLSGYGKPTFLETVVKELERCHKAGAKGIGELTDKGLGIYLAFQDNRADGLHLDDPLMTPIYDKCAELNMPLNIHVAEPYWMYLEPNCNNDGMINADTWHIDLNIRGMKKFEELISDFGNAVEKHPNTTFIACHFLNCPHDLSILSGMFDKYSNLYADISARLGETGSIPRFMNSFITKYADRIFYGTDNGMSLDMYRTSFRFLETEDEHFYVPDFGYHWSYSGFNLPDPVLKKIYYENVKQISKR